MSRQHVPVFVPVNIIEENYQQYARRHTQSHSRPSSGKRVHFKPSSRPQSATERPKPAMVAEKENYDYHGLTNQMRNVKFRKSRYWREKSPDKSHVPQTSRGKDDVPHYKEAWLDSKTGKTDEKPIDVHALRTMRSSYRLRYKYPQNFHKNPLNTRGSATDNRYVPGCIRRMAHYTNQPRKQTCVFKPPNSMTGIRWHNLVSDNRNKPVEESFDEPEVEDIHEETPPSDEDKEDRERNGSYHIKYKGPSKTEILRDFDYSGHSKTNIVRDFDDSDDTKSPRSPRESITTTTYSVSSKDSKDVTSDSDQDRKKRKRRRTRKKSRRDKEDGSKGNRASNRSKSPSSDAPPEMVIEKVLSEQEEIVEWKTVVSEKLTCNAYDSLDELIEEVYEERLGPEPVSVTPDVVKTPINDASDEELSIEDETDKFRRDLDLTEMRDIIKDTAQSGVSSLVSADNTMYYTAKEELKKDSEQDSDKYSENDKSIKSKVSSKHSKSSDSLSISSSTSSESSAKSSSDDLKPAVERSRYIPTNSSFSRDSNAPKSPRRPYSRQSKDSSLGTPTRPMSRLSPDYPIESPTELDAVLDQDPMEFSRKRASPPGSPPPERPAASLGYNKTPETSEGDDAPTEGLPSIKVTEAEIHDFMGSKREGINIKRSESTDTYGQSRTSRGMSDYESDEATPPMTARDSSRDSSARMYSPPQRPFNGLGQRDDYISAPHPPRTPNSGAQSQFIGRRLPKIDSGSLKYMDKQQESDESW